MLAGIELDPRQHRFAQLGIRDPDHVHVRNLGVGVQKILHLARINILAAADDGIFGASLEAEITIRTQHRQVTGVQPAFAIDCFSRGHRVGVIALHHQVAAGAQFALLA